MNKNHLKSKLLILCVFLCSFSSIAQITPGNLQQFLSDKKQLNTISLENLAGVKEFYSILNYQTAWIGKSKSANLTTFFNTLNLAENFGLVENDYQFNFIESYKRGTFNLQNLTDSLEAEIRITDAAIHFYNDITNGNTKPALGYNGLKYKPACSNIPALLAEYVSNNLLQLLINKLSPTLPEIFPIENKIRWFNKTMASTNFTEAKIKSGKVNSTNKPLIEKLYQLGITDSLYKKLPDSTLKQKVKEAQRLFNLPPDGILHSATLKELNVPLFVRIQQLSLAINYYRWLYCLAKDQPVIVVNIPASYMKVYQGSKVIIEMRMIVGKKTNRTPTLASTVNEIILYPYWHVPYKIATKELLPIIKRNPAYLDDNYYQVLNRAGKVVNPYSVNWNEFSTGYFPYLIRQSTGCDNSLGLLKLNFYNPFGVYLHDTPTKGLFKYNNRFFSHGCMRMEKPMELGHLILKNNSIAIDTLEEKGCLQNQSPIIVPADNPMPVIVWYNPAGVDSTGRVLFYNDMYEKFSWEKTK